MKPKVVISPVLVRRADGSLYCPLMREQFACANGTSRMFGGGLSGIPSKLPPVNRHFRIIATLDKRPKHDVAVMVKLWHDTHYFYATPKTRKPKFSFPCMAYPLLKRLKVGSRARYLYMKVQPLT